MGCFHRCEVFSVVSDLFRVFQKWGKSVSYGQLFGKGRVAPHAIPQNLEIIALTCKIFKNIGLYAKYSKTRRLWLWFIVKERPASRHFMCPMFIGDYCHR